MEVMEQARAGRRMKNGGEQWDLVGIKECEGEWGTWGSSGMEANVDGERPGYGVSWWTRQPPEQVLAGRGQVTGPGPLGDLPVRHHRPEPSPVVPDDPRLHLQERARAEATLSADEPSSAAAALQEDPLTDRGAPSLQGDSLLIVGHLGEFDFF